MKFLSLKLFLKLLWTFTYIFSSLGLSLYIYELYMKYNFNPDITTTEKVISSNEIPMPAITICSPIIIRSWIFNPKLHQVGNGTSKADQFNALYQHICIFFYAVERIKLFPYHVENHVKLLDESFHAIDETFGNCEFQRKEIECDEMLRRVLTHFGFCFSFNLLDFKQIFDTREISEDFKSYENSKVNNWTLEKGFEDGDDYPNRMIQTNRVHFRVTLFHNQMSNLCTNIGKNVLIFLHLPNEIMTPFHPENYIELGKTKEVKLEARKFSADESLRSYTPEP